MSRNILFVSQSVPVIVQLISINLQTRCNLNNRIVLSKSKCINYSLHICLNDLWESTSISPTASIQTCAFPTNGPNYNHLNKIYSVQKDRSMWSQRRKSDSESESVSFLTNFETDLHATVSDVYY